MKVKIERKAMVTPLEPYHHIYDAKINNFCYRVLRIEHNKQVQENLQWAGHKRYFSTEKIKTHDILCAGIYHKDTKERECLYYLVEDITPSTLTVSEGFKNYSEARQRKEELQGNDIEIFSPLPETEAEIEGEENVIDHENEPTDITYMDGVVEDDWREKVDFVKTEAELLKVIIKHCKEENLKGEDADNYIIYTLKCYKEWLMRYATDFAKRGKKYHLDNVIQYLGKVRTIYNNLSEMLGTGKKVDDDFKTYYYSEEVTMLKEMLNKKSA